MPKILHTATIAGCLGALLLASAIILPCQAANKPVMTTLYNFTDNPTYPSPTGDGGFPEAGLTLASTGALYGTTSTGGAGGWGTVFEMIPSKGGTWTQKTLYSFTGGADGANPIADLVVSPSNVLYGTTYGGGAHNCGTVFQVAQVQVGVWQQKVLYSFAGGSDGANPAAGLALASTQVLYGTTYNGGTAGLGTAFELIPAKTGWTEKVLYSFQGGVDGENPLADLFLASNGSLFGTTSQGGSFTNTNGTAPGWGTAFELTNTSGAWSESVLYTFTGGADGGTPESALIPGPSGIFYGTTFWGGSTNSCPVGEYAQGCGTLYQLSPPTGSGTTWTETTLHSFVGELPAGQHPYGNIVLNKSGFIFGTTFAGGSDDNVCAEAYTGCGTIFSAKQTSGVWSASDLFVFPGSPGGGNPNGLVISTGGAVYGTTVVGGSSGGYGTAFEMIP
jgi:uncharacterized repeat protein (TIGR03803 family)